LVNEISPYDDARSKKHQNIDLINARKMGRTYYNKYWCLKEHYGLLCVSYRNSEMSPVMKLVLLGVCLGTFSAVIRKCLAYCVPFFLPKTFLWSSPSS